MNLNSIGGSSSLQQLQQAMFAKIDANGDGQLSSDEFLSIGQKLQGGGNSGAAREMRGRVGGGGDFASATMGSMLSLQEMQSRREARAEIFTGADSDGDGALTAEELAADMAAHAPRGADGDTTEMAAGLIAQADADGDGALSVDEFKAARPPAPPPGGGMGPTASTEDTIADPLDTDGDGTVSMSELLASLQTVEEDEGGFSAEVSDLFSQLIAKLTEETTSTVSQAA